MALLVPTGGPCWAYCLDNNTGTPDTTPGTAITVGTSNANGSTVSLLSTIPFDLEYIIITAGGFYTSGAVNRTQLDIMIDPAGGTTWNTTPFIADLLVGGWADWTSSGAQTAYHFPVRVPAGSSLGVRGRTTHTVAPSGTSVIITGYASPSNPELWWCGQSVIAVGTDAANSAGTVITAGASGAYGGWASVGSTLAYRAGAIQYGLQTRLSTHIARQYYFEGGAGSTRIGSRLWCQVTTSEIGYQVALNGPIFCDIPAGTQLQARGVCSGTTPDGLDFAAYVVV